MSLKVVTFGCRLNIYESEIIKQHAKKFGIDNAIIFNSCAVTQEAEKKLRQAIRKAKNDMPNRKILVTGCAAQISTEKYSAMPQVDSVFGNHDKLLEKTYEKLAINSHPIIVNDIMSINETAHYMLDEVENKSKAFLQIQNGCNHRCTFCIIPYGRGNSRSVPVGEIVRYANNLVSKGYKELVLTGVDITDYGLDLPGKPSLGNMITRLLIMTPGIERLRLSSVDIAEIDDELFDVITNNNKFMPHLHLSLQSGDDMILKRMKRRHRRQQVIDFCHKVWEKRPSLVLGADVIAGFPTETDEMFANTYNLINELNIIHLHVFPYSARDNTPASKMPQVQSHIIKERAKKLRDLKNQLMTNHLQKKIGQKEMVLAESNNYGYTEDYCQVLSTEDLTRGEVYKLTISSVSNTHLLA